MAYILWFIKQYVEQIPLPFADNAQKAEVENLANQILTIKSTTDSADLEAALDSLVYAQYSLTEEDIVIVEE